jgi:FlaA1/EpsC-like NDP-sugar epimerase
MILLSGRVPGQDIKITYTGLRPGEKMYEELFDQNERVEPTEHEKIKRAVGQPAFTPYGLERHLQELETLLSNGDPEKLIRKLQEMISNYNPSTPNATK